VSQIERRMGKAKTGKGRSCRHGRGDGVEGRYMWRGSDPLARRLVIMYAAPHRSQRRRDSSTLMNRTSKNTSVPAEEYSPSRSLMGGTTRS
jgi:hypothetical protein